MNLEFRKDLRIKEFYEKLKVFVTILFCYLLVVYQLFLLSHFIFSDIFVNVRFWFSGSGKSALVANWSKRLDDSDPDAFKFVHFIGSSADSASYTKILRR